MTDEFVGAASLELDGREVEVQSISVTTVTGKRLVKTMNRKRRAKGFSRGITTYDINLTAVIPVNGPPIDWDNIESAKITIAPVGTSGRTSYRDAFTIQAGKKYQLEGEAVIDVNMGALDKVEE